MKNKYLIIILLLVWCAPGCKKLVEIPPPISSQTSETVYQNDATATAVLIGVYSQFGSVTNTVYGGSINTLFIGTGLTGDELTLFGGSANFNTNLVELYLNKLSPGQTTQASNSSWYEFYSRIYGVNLAIERLSAATSLTPAVKQQLLGEAKFFRAFYYFYLTNLFGDVPLTTTSDYTVNLKLSRSPQQKVFEQVATDLKDAQQLLTDTYVAGDSKSSSTEKIRVNKWAATALLSRTYLYMKDWANAEAQATAIIGSGKYSITSLGNAFIKNNEEAIWQAQPISLGWNTYAGYVFVLPPTGPTANSSVVGNPVFLSSSLVNSFEPNDKRKTNWTGNVTVNGNTYYYAYKYKVAALNMPVTEYETILRLGEQYLIRAEARAQLNKLAEAASDLNVIRGRAGLPDYTTSDKNALLTKILQERQVELFTEWSHRWLDLKRTNTIDAVMNAVAPQKSSTWNHNWSLFPIPVYDITENPNLTQNPGY
jgi:hypothetical protein